MIIRSISRGKFFILIILLILNTKSLYSQLTIDRSYSSGWLENRKYEEGPGIKLGERMVFHPGIGLEGGYDNNLFLQPESTLGAGRIRVSATLDFATRPKQREGENGEPHTIDFNLGTTFIYNEYLSENKVVQDRRNLDIEATLSLLLFPQKLFSFFISDIFVRHIEPRYDLQEGFSIDKDRNEARLGFIIAPGQGIFELNLNYGFIYNYYENGGDLAILGNSMEHEINLDLKWKFLPKTALLFHGQFIPIIHEEGVTSTGIRNYSSYHVKGMIGLIGLITPKFSLLAEIGYGAGFYEDNTPDADTFIGKIGLIFNVTPFVRIQLGYDRDFKDSLWANYFTRDHGYLSYSHLIAGKVLVELRGGFSWFSYAPFEFQGTTYNRNDPIIDISLFAEYRIRNWLGINGTISYEGNFTEFSWYDVIGERIVPTDYQKVIFMLGARFRY